MNTQKTGTNMIYVTLFAELVIFFSFLLVATI